MADTIARLIFEANTAQLKKANDELKELAKESGRVTRSIKDGDDAIKASSKIKASAASEQKKISAAVAKAEIKAYQEQIKRNKDAAISLQKAEEAKSKAAEKSAQIQEQEAVKAAAAQQKAADKAAAAAQKQSAAIEKASLKAQAAKEKEAQKAQAVLDKAFDAASKEDALRTRAAQKQKELAQANKEAAENKQKESEETKKANAIRKAEINAYKESASRKNKAAKEAEKLAKKEKQLKENAEKLTKATEKGASATDKLSDGFRNASTSTAAFSGPLNGLSGRLSFIATGLNRVGVRGLAVGVSFITLAAAIGKSLRVFSDYETQMFKLEAIVKSTGMTAGFSAKSLDDMAVQMARDTLASASEMREAQGVLLTFKTVQGDIFRNAISLTQDLGAVMGTTAVSGAKQLGKALEDPSRNLTALTRAGVSFTQAESDKIKQLQFSGDLLAAQTIIIEKLSDQVGGAGKGGGLAGATDLLSDNFTLLAERFAEVTGLAKLATVVVGAFANVIGFLADALITTPEEKLAKLNAELERTSKIKAPVGLSLLFADPRAVGSGGAGTRSEDTIKAEIKKIKEDALVKAAVEDEQAQDALDKINKKNTDELAAFERKNKLKLLQTSESLQKAQGLEFSANKTRLDAALMANEQEYNAQVEKYGKLDSLLQIKLQKDRLAQAEADKFVQDSIDKRVQDEKDAQEKLDKAKEKAAEKSAAKQERTEENIASQEAELEQVAVYILERQNRLVEAATFEKALKETAAQEEMDRQIASGEFSTQLALDLHTAKMQRIQEEYEEKREIIAQEEQKELDLLTKKEIKKRDIVEKVSNMALKSVSKNLKKGLGEGKSAAIKGVAIDAAMGAGKVLINGAIEAAGIKAAYAQLAAATSQPQLAAVGVQQALVAMKAAKALALKTAAITFGTGSIGVALGGGGGDGGGGGSAASAAAPVQPAEVAEVVQAPQAINVTVDGSIDPEGARRIIEAINEATEDGLEINALVGS